MMYNNKLAIAIKSNGKVLREFKDTVYVPFGTEYSLLIKNLNTVRAQVRVTIDGTDATDGVWLIIQPNSEMELTRFIKNGNLKEGNRFKFIERTEGVEKHRGVKLEDGLIRIEYQFEKPYDVSRLIEAIKPSFPPLRERWIKKEYWDKEYYFDSYRSPTITTCGSGLLRSAIASDTYASPKSYAASEPVSATLSSSAPVLMNSVGASATCSSDAVVAQNATLSSFNEAGITVPGSISDQQFTVASSFDVEPTTHVMVIKLLGETEQGNAVQKPVTVKAKPKCVTCGHTNKAKAKFCSECGTALQIV